MKTAGLFDKDCRLYYVGANLVVVDEPCKGKTVIVQRHPGGPNKTEIQDVLARLDMKLVGQPDYREDGLWFCEVREVAK